MSKVISFVEIIVGIILLFVPGGQPLGVMLIVGGVTGLAASYLAPGTPKIGRSDKNAPVQHISVDPDAYGTLVYGEAKCGGVMIYQNVCSSDGSQTYDILDYVVAHCFTDLTRGVEHMGAIYVNDQLIPESSIDGSGNVVSGDFAGMVQVWRYDGTQTAADPVLRSAYGSDPELPWPSTAIGKGICYTHYRFKSGTDSDAFNRAFSGGPPNNVATVIKGEKPYDPRTSAYAYSENPAVCLRDFMTRADNGAGVPTTYLDATMLAASANICDEVITYPDGTTTGPRFKCDGASGLGDSRKAIIGDILASMAGEVIQSNGLLSVRSGSYTPPSGTITEDFLSGAATSSEPTQDMRYNHVLTNYIGPKSNWQSVQAPAYPALSSAKYAAWLAQDGTRLDKQLGLKMVTNPENAQVIEQIVGNQSRYMRGVSMQCNAKALAFTTGDRVTLNIPECGEVNKIFKITGMRLRPDFGADVQLVADDPSIYGWDNVIAVDVPGLPLPVTKYSAPPVVTGFVCKPQADGIGIAWTAPDVNKVDLTEVQRGTASAGPFSAIYRGFSNSLVDHLPDDDSTYYYRARNYLGGTYSAFTPVQSQAGKIVATAADIALVAAPGANLIVNSAFQLWPSGGPTGWVGTFNGAIPGWASGPQGHFGLGPTEPPTLLEFATNSATSATYLVTTNPINVAANALISLSLRYAIFLTLATGNFVTDIQYLDSTGTSIGYSAHQFLGNADTGDYLVKKIEGLVTPAGCAQVSVRIYAEHVTSSGSVVYLRVGWVKLEIGPQCTPYNDFATQFGNLLTVAGSQQTIGDQRNMLPVTWAGVRSVLSGSPVAFSISGTTVNFTVAAVTVNAGGFTVSYSASAANVTQSAGTTVTWYLYYRDLNATGGAKTLYVSSSVQALAAYPDIVMLGYADVTTASGGGGSSGSGSGGGGYCVCEDMWVDADTQANDAQPGYLFDCCNLPTHGTETFKRALQSVDYHDELCVRITTDGGAQLDCGHTTPFDTVDGRVLRAPQMDGEIVLTDDGLQRVANVEWIGVRRVCYFHFGGISYAAGRDPSHRIYSHNPGPHKP